MIPVTVLAHRRVAVFGLGESGLATAQVLLAGGADVTAFDDDRAKVERAAAASVPTADLRHIDWAGLAALVLSPGVALTHPAPHWVVGLARSAGVEVIGDIELYCRQRRALAPRAPFIAVTGTNGKSTTTALISHLLNSAKFSAEPGGNIGVPVLSLTPPHAGHAHVIECSSYQIDLAPTLDPTVGILINVTPDHLDRHGTMSNYAAIKERLVTGVGSEGTAIVGVDDDWGQRIADRLERAERAVLRVSVREPLADGLYLEDGQILQARGGATRPVARIGGIDSLRGVHNAQNAACAVAATLTLGLDDTAIQAGLLSFPGLAHRMEQVGRRNGVAYVNDSKATNAEAAARALACYSDIFWIAGGRAKAGGISGLSGFFPRIRKAYLIGEAAGEFAATLDGEVAHVMAGTLERAVELASHDAEVSGLDEPVVLLSPACASFDQFPNFEARGAQFRAVVHALGA